jgi:hypothetical protein
MFAWLKQLDRLLRGDATRLDALRGGDFTLPVAGIAIMAAVLGMIYGACMGVFALTGGGRGEALQVLASALKVPALFFLTLVVTFPSLYVFNALVGSRLSLLAVLRLMVASISIMITVLASLGPIVAFFALTTTSYPFMKLLNVLVFAVAGILGGGFLLRTLQRLTLAAERELAGTLVVPPPVAAPPSPPAGTLSLAGARPGALVPPPVRPAQSVQFIFRVWVVVFGFVGAQMAWIMRPFIGNPEQPFTWFRPTSSNFFEAVFRALEKLFS